GLPPGRRRRARCVGRGWLPPGARRAGSPPRTSRSLRAPSHRSACVAPSLTAFPPTPWFIENFVRRNRHISTRIGQVGEGGALIAETCALTTLQPTLGKRTHVWL